MSENSLVTLAVIALIVSAVAAGYAYSSSNNYKAQVTGFDTAQATATVNLTVQSSVAINFTTDNVNFANGTVNVGNSYAILDTSTGGVANGSWTGNSAGFVLENIGNKNVTINLKADKNAASFIGGTNPEFQLNVTNSASHPNASCANFGGYTPSTWFSVATGDTPVCNDFGFTENGDELRIDVKLVVPSDSFTGALGSVITATASAP